VTGVTARGDYRGCAVQSRQPGLGDYMTDDSIDFQSVVTKVHRPQAYLKFPSVTSSSAQLIPKLTGSNFGPISPLDSYEEVNL